MVASLCLLGCTDDSSVPQCYDPWLVEVATTASRIEGADILVQVQGSGLTLEEARSGTQECGSKTPPCRTVKVYQAGVVGDFQAVWQLESFIGGGTFATAAAFVAEVNGQGTAQAKLMKSNIEGNLVSVEVNAGMRSQEGLATSASAATLSLQRTGEKLTVTSQTSSGEKATLTKAFGTGELRVGVAIDAASDETTSTTARFPDFTIQGGGGSVRNDSFDCDSIMQ